MFRPLAPILAAALLLSGCRNDLQSKEKVQQAILDRIQTKSRLDLKTLDVTTTSVSFEKDMAYATVSFHPKGDAAIDSGMLLKYTLQQQGGKWVVVKVNDSQGNSMGAHSGTGDGELPPGHPPLDQLPSSEGQLPPGHPAVDGSNPEGKSSQGDSTQKR